MKGPYRKFIPIIKKFKDKDYIITFFDDDWIYPKMLISKMYETYCNFKNCVITCNAQKMFYSNGNVIFKNNKYKDKSFNDTNNPRLDL